LADIAWEKRYTRSNNAKKFYSLKDTVLAFRATRSMDSIKEGRTEKSKTNYANPDKDPRGPWISSSYVNPAKKEARTNLVYPIANPFTGKSVDHPTHAWKYDKNTHETHVKENRLYWGEDGSYEYPRLKSFLSEASDGMVPVDFWRYQETGTTDDGGKTVKELFGDSVFSNPKPVTLVTKILGLSGGSSCEDVVCDIFAGSGTTAHAVIKLNREDARNRKYVLAEVGEHFEHVIVPRLKKVVHSMDWKDGKPQHRNTGVSHALKIVRLEGYEDALNNLRLTRTPGQQIALAAAPERTRDDYLLGYFLDVESAGSASLLDLDQFRDPFAYKLNIAASTVGETRETPIDLVETFNWLLGLKVKHMDAQRGFLTVTGEKRAGGRTLVIWRTLSDDAVSDNRALEAFLDKIAVNPADTEFDYIYLNGSHTLADPHTKVHLTEEAFQRLMFDAPDFGMEA
jgi:adenine-specific DNA-methyltransferase